MVNLYNPGSKGIYTIRLKVVKINLLVINQKNTILQGDIICANMKDD